MDVSIKNLDKKVEVVIPIIKENLPFFFEYIVPALQRNIEISHIVLIGKKDLLDRIRISNIDFQDEDLVYSKMTLNKIKEQLRGRQANVARAGWYFQQFLKMAWAYKTHEEKYLVWDSDTIPLNKISFFDSDKILYNEKIEFHKPYFKTIENLFHGKIKKKIEGSFIAEHMVIDTKIMRDMIDEISKDAQIEGNYFWEKILSSVSDLDLSHSGFSEFETFGNYAVTVSSAYKPRALRTLRAGRVFLGTQPSNKSLQDAAKYYDLVSIEGPQKKFCSASRVMPLLTGILRCCFIPLPMIVKLYINLRKCYFNKFLHKETLILE